MPKYQTELLQQLTAETVQQKIDECTQGWVYSGQLFLYGCADRRPGVQKGIEGQYAVTITL